MKPLEKALIIGDLLLIESAEGTQLGGWATSFAVQLKRLGIQPMLASGVGNDENGSRAIRELDTLGLDTSLIGIERRMKTNTARIEVASEDAPRYLTLPIGAADAVATSQGLFMEATSTQLLYFNSFSLRTIISKTCTTAVRERAQQAYKVFDLRMANGFIPDETVFIGLSDTDLVRVSQPDLARVTHALELPTLSPMEFCHVMINRFRIKTCVISDPLRGIVAASEDEEAIIEPTSPKQLPHNVIGWHETFLAGFVVEKYKNSPLQQCIDYGHQYANNQG